MMQRIAYCFGRFLVLSLSPTSRYVLYIFCCCWTTKYWFVVNDIGCSFSMVIRRLRLHVQSSLHVRRIVGRNMRVWPKLWANLVNMI